jgi:ubiquitin-protein ligase
LIVNFVIDTQIQYRHINIYLHMATINPMTRKRILRDIADIYKSPLTDMNIYYQHDDEDIFKGYAAIIGPKDTPYEDGLYCFDITFPTDYPISPPLVVFRSFKERINPNLYENGKVCLSILNTWAGEQWSACQSLRSVLNTLVSILTEMPLLNEPHIVFGKSAGMDTQIYEYNAYVMYCNLLYHTIEYIQNGCSGTHGIFMKPYMDYLDKAKVLRRIEDMVVSGYKVAKDLMICEGHEIKTMYGHKVVIRYNALLELYRRIVSGK